MRRVDREGFIRFGAERSPDDQHGDDREHQHEGQRERVTDEQAKLRSQQTPGRGARTRGATGLGGLPVAGGGGGDGVGHDASPCWSVWPVWPVWSVWLVEC